MPLTNEGIQDFYVGSFFAMLVIHRPSRKVHRVNQEALELVGYGRAEVEGKDILRFISSRAGSTRNSLKEFFKSTATELSGLCLLEHKDHSFSEAEYHLKVHHEHREFVALMLIPRPEFGHKTITPLKEPDFRSEDALICIDLMGNISSWNRKAEEIFDFTADEVIGQSIYRLIPEEEQEIFNRNLEHAVRGKVLSTFTSKRSRKNNSKIDVMSTLIPMIEGHRVTSIIKVIRDISGDIETINRLKDQNKQLTLLTEALHAQKAEMVGLSESLNQSALISITDKKGIIIHANKEFCEISKYNADELIGSNHRILNSGYHDRAFWVEMWKTISAGHRWRQEVRNKAKDGSLYWVDTVINPIFNNDGKIEKYLSIRYLITDKKHLQERNREALVEYSLLNQKLNMVLEASEHGVWEYDLINQQVSCSPLMFKLFGIVSEQEGKQIGFWQKFFMRSEYIRIARALESAIQSGDKYELATYIVLPKGRYVYLMIKGGVSFDEQGKPVLLSGTITDITQQKAAEAALIESQKQYRALVEESGDLTTKLSPKGIFLYLSPSAKQILGYESYELIGENMLKFVHPAERKNVKQGLQDMLTSREGDTDMTIRFRHRTGTYCWLSVSTTPILNEKGEVTYLMSRAVDVSKRIETEKHLKETKELLSSFFESPGAMRGIVQLEKNDILYILGNKQHRKPNPHMTGRLASEIGIPPEMIRVWRSQFIKSKRKGIPQKFEYSIDGNTYSVSVSYIGDTHRKSRYTYIMYNITEKKKVEEELQAKREMLSNIADQIPGLILRSHISPEGKLTYEYISKGSRNLWGLDPELMFRNPEVFWRVIHPADLPKYKKTLSEAIKHQRQFKMDYRAIRTNGEVIWINQVGSPRKMPDKSVLWDTLALDITDKKLAELEVRKLVLDLEMSLNDKDTLLQELHHRIKNNLQLINSLLYLKLGAESDEKLIEFIEETTSRITSISFLHEQLLHNHSVNQVRIKDYLENLMATILSTYYGDKEFKVRQLIGDYDLDIDNVLYIGLIVNELVTNILKHAYPTEKEGEIFLRFEAVGKKYIMEIGDKGKGFDMNMVERSGSFGFQLITLMTSQLSGKMEYKNDFGSLFRFEFKQ